MAFENMLLLFSYYSCVQEKVDEKEVWGHAACLDAGHPDVCSAFLASTLL